MDNISAINVHHESIIEFIIRLRARLFGHIEAGRREMSGATSQHKIIIINKHSNAYDYISREGILSVWIYICD